MIRNEKIQKDRLIPTLMAIPFALLIFCMNYMPIVGWVLAITDYRPGKAWAKVEYVGLKYFQLFGFYWDDVSRALRNTLLRLLFRDSSSAMVA